MEESPEPEELVAWGALAPKEELPDPKARSLQVKNMSSHIPARVIGPRC